MGLARHPEHCLVLHTDSKAVIVVLLTTTIPPFNLKHTQNEQTHLGHKPKAAHACMLRCGVLRLLPVGKHLHPGPNLRNHLSIAFVFVFCFLFLFFLSLFIFIFFIFVIYFCYIFILFYFIFILFLV